MIVSGSIRSPSAVAKPAFEIGAPHPVRRIGRSKRLGVRWSAPPLLARRPPILRAPASRRWCSPPATAAAAARALTLVSICAAPNSCAPAATPAPPLRPSRRLVRMSSRSPASILQRLRPSLPVAPQPVITGLPRDVVDLAQLRHRLQTTLLLQYKPHSLVHDTARFPGHLPFYTPQSTAVSGMSPV